VALWLGVAASTAWPQVDEAIAWKTGPALERELAAPLSLTWHEREARAALGSLSRSTSVAIFLDRRLDPSRLLELSAQNEPLRTVVVRVAEQLAGSVSLVGPVVYVSPQGTAGMHAALASNQRQAIGSLGREAQLRLLRSEAWQWEELTEPRTLLASLADEGGVRVVNPELLPHDLWPAANLPALLWVERMTLLLAGFDLSFELSPEGQAIRLVPIPADFAFERVYPLASDSDARVSKLRGLVPAAKIAIAGRQLRATASVADHQQIARALSDEPAPAEGTTSPPAAAGKLDPGKRYTVTVQNQPAGSVVATVAKQLGIKARFERATSARLTTKISLSVKDVPLGELMKKTLTPLGLVWRIEGEELVIEQAVNE
jgi:hypothetical protein